MLSTITISCKLIYEQVRATVRLLKSLALGTNKLYSEVQLLREQQDPLHSADRLTRGPALFRIGSHTLK